MKDIIFLQEGIEIMKLRKRIVSIMLTLMMVLLCAAPASAAETAPTKAAGAISQKSVTMYVGNTTKLTVDGVSGKVKWSSSNKSVATVSTKGKVTALKKGKATITAKVGKKTFTCKVKVKEPSLSTKKLTIRSGLSAYVELNGSKIKTARSSNPKVAKITKDGKIKAKNPGTATITIVSKSKKQYTCLVTVVAGIGDSKLALTAGDAKGVKLYGTTIKSAKSSNKKVATVDKKGKIKAKKAGKATITVVGADNKSYKCKVTVSPKATKKTITFDSNGGSEVKSQKVITNGFAEKPAVPEKNGYMFANWYTDSACEKEFDFGTRITKNTTLYAKWIPNSYYGSIYTRGEWIDKLATLIDMNLSTDAATMDHYFADTQDSEYVVAIETAYAYGILPDVVLEDEEQDVPCFEPNGIADREFVAYTLAKALGLQSGNADSFACGDKSDLKYASEDCAVVQADLMRLVDGDFKPTASLTSADLQLITDKAKNILDSVNLANVAKYDKSEFSNNTLKDELKKETKYTVTENGDGSVNVVIKQDSATSQIHNGSVIVLPANSKNPEGVALKVDKVVNLGNKYRFTGTAPKLEEVYSSIDFVSAAKADVNNLTAASGVKVSYDPNGVVIPDDSPLTMKNINLGGSVGLPGKLKYDIHEKKFGQFVKLKGSVEISIPDITAKVNADAGLFSGIEIKEVTFSMTEKIKIEEKLEATLLESGYELTNSAGATRFEGGRIELGRVPFAIPNAPGLSVDVIFFVNVSAKGSVSVSYTINATEGFQYKDGSFRWIKDFRDSLDAIEIKGSASVTVGAGLELTAFELMDLVGATFEVGPAFEASFTAHALATDTLYCGDISLYLTAKAALDKESVLGKLLDKVWHYTLEIELLKNDKNNPIKLALHIENGHKVPYCTFGRGVLEGKVVDAATNSPIVGARMQIYTKDTHTLIRTRYTDSRGIYKVDNLDAGSDYAVSISANGYERYDSEVSILTAENTYAEVAKMLKRTDEIGTLNLGANDAITGRALSDFSYVIRKGWNNTTGEVVKSGRCSSMKEAIELPSNNYTVVVTKDGYIETIENVAVIEYRTVDIDVTLCPNDAGTFDFDNNICVVLRWGEYPRDLDSHMFGPDGSDGRFHTWFSHKTATDYAGNKIADLDVDDTSSYGPETSTVYGIKDGVYSFYVHDYTNRYNYSSTGMATSGAKVFLYANNRITTFFVPTSGVGTVWHVFDYNSVTKEIIPVNSFSGHDPYVYDAASGEGADSSSDIDELLNSVNNTEKSDVAEDEEISSDEVVIDEADAEAEVVVDITDDVTSEATDEELVIEGDEDVVEEVEAIVDEDTIVETEDNAISEEKVDLL